MTRNNEGQASVVGSCSATDCRYNENRECHAGQVQVSMQGTTAQCATYDPSAGAGGRGERPSAGNR